MVDSTPEPILKDGEGWERQRWEGKSIQAVRTEEALHYLHIPKSGQLHFLGQTYSYSIDYNEMESLAPQNKGFPGPAILFLLNAVSKYYFKLTPEVENFMCLDTLGPS